MRTLMLFVLAVVLSSSAVRAEEMLILRDDKGQELQAIAAGPAESEIGVLIVHDWFGISDLTKETVDRLGRKGVRSIAVDLFAGQAAHDHEEAQRLSAALDPDDAQDMVLAGLKALNADRNPVAVVGYSMGGRIALRAASENPDLVRSVAIIYGGGFSGIDDKMLSAAGPILAVTGSADEWSYVEHAGLEKRLRALGGQMETYVYPGADHAFAQHLYNEGKNYDQVATEAMRNVLDDFLGRHLGVAMADR